VFEKNNNDMIYNWRNELKANQNGAFLVAETIASELKTAGHSKSDVIELLAAQEFDLELTNRVASKLFDNVTSAPKPTVQVAVVPTKYADCAPTIERSKNYSIGYSGSSIIPLNVVKALSSLFENEA